MRLSHPWRLLAHPYALLCYTVTFWSGNMVIARAVRTEISPLYLAIGRWSIALLLTFIWALPRLTPSWPLLRAHLPTMAALALFGVSGYNTLAYLALQTTPATNAGLINAFIPLATLLLARLWLKEPISLSQLIGILLALIGVIWVIGQGSLSPLFELTVNLGDLWMVMAVLTWAIYTVLLRRRPLTLDPIVQLFISILLGLIFLLILIPLGILSDPPPSSLSPAAFFAVLYTGIFPAFLGYLFYNTAVAQVGASRAALFINLMPILIPLLSWIFLDEPPAGYHFLALLLILTGIAIATNPSLFLFFHRPPSS